jgi:hypothetical protein
VQITTKEVYDYKKVDVRDNISSIKTDIPIFTNDRKTIDMEADA